MADTIKSTDVPSVHGLVALNPDGTAIGTPVGGATSANQTNGSQKTQIVDAVGEAVTVTGGKLDVNASIDTTGLATSTNQETLITELRVFNGAYAMRVDDVSGGTLYQGWALPGTLTSAASWRIRKIVSSGTPEDTVITFADGDSNFNNIWDDRLTITYS